MKFRNLIDLMDFFKTEMDCVKYLYNRRIKNNIPCHYCGCNDSYLPKNNTRIMVEIFGKSYYIDLDGITEKCGTGSKINEEDGNEVTEINIFKYEVIKMCLDRILSEYDEVDEGLGPFAQNNTTTSFKIAFNTLIKYQILIEDNE